MLAAILSLFGVLAIAFLIYVALKPADFRVERSTDIDAPSERIYPFINDLRQFNSWNPWARADPSSEITYSGPSSGVGAAYEWAGKKSGAGRMQIATSTPSNRVTMNLDFTKPFAASNKAEFTLVPRGTSTTVTWAMTGRHGSFIYKLMSTIFNMDRMVGGEFAKGLKTLKSMVEGRAP